MSQKIDKLARLAAGALGPLHHTTNHRNKPCRREYGSLRARMISVKASIYSGSHRDRAKLRARLRHAVMLAKHAEHRVRHLADVGSGS